MARRNKTLALSGSLSEAKRRGKGESSTTAKSSIEHDYQDPSLSSSSNNHINHARSWASVRQNLNKTLVSRRMNHGHVGVRSPPTLAPTVELVRPEVWTRGGGNRQRGIFSGIRIHLGVYMLTTSVPVARPFHQRVVNLNHYGTFAPAFHPKNRSRFQVVEAPCLSQKTFCEVARTFYYYRRYFIIHLSRRGSRKAQHTRPSTKPSMGAHPERIPPARRLYEGPGAVVKRHASKLRGKRCTILSRACCSNRNELYFKA